MRLVLRAIYGDNVTITTNVYIYLSNGMLGTGRRGGGRTCVSHPFTTESRHNRNFRIEGVHQLREGAHSGCRIRIVKE
jgi:hypothetical protein